MPAVVALTVLTFGKSSAGEPTAIIRWTTF